MFQDRIYAVKVIKKEALMNKPLHHSEQLMKEIQIQRKLALCGNTIKLFKIYESDKYINMVMEYQDGGSLGDFLEK
jgi:serine/threonine protein kinase